MTSLFTRLACLLMALSLAWPGLADPPATKKPLILVTQKPFALLVHELLGDAVELHQLIPDGISPHGFNLSWSGRRQLDNANLVVWGGADLEPHLKGVMAALPSDRIFDASSAVVSWVNAAECQAHEHHGDDHHPHENETSAGTSDGLGCRDAHFWLDSRNMAAVAHELLRELAEAELATSSGWEDFVAALEDQDARTQSSLRDLTAYFFVVEHDAYNHFIQRYGLSRPGFLRAGHGVPLGSRSFARLLEHGDVTCVFTEPEYSPVLAERVARQTGARLAELDPLGSKLAMERGYTGLLADFSDAFIGCLAKGADDPGYPRERP